jgi:hypothetical protein
MINHWMHRIGNGSGCECVEVMQLSKTAECLLCDRICETPENEAARSFLSIQVLIKPLDSNFYEGINPIKSILILNKRDVRSEKFLLSNSALCEQTKRNGDTLASELSGEFFASMTKRAHFLEISPLFLPTYGENYEN